MNQGWVIEYAPAINNPIWYICVLVWLYLIYYAAEKIIRRFGREAQYARIAAYCIFILVGAAGWHFRFDAPFLHLSDCRGYAGFFLGVLLCHLSQRIEQNKNGRKVLMVVSAIVLFLSVAVILIARNFSWYVWTLAICPSVVILLVLLPQIESTLQKRVDFSGVSFYVYLWHVPTFCAFQLMIDVFNSDFNHSILSMMVSLIVVVVISLLMDAIVPAREK